jgi:hypothetical protein
MTKKHLTIFSLLLFAGMTATAHWLGLLPGGQSANLMLEPSIVDFGRVPAGTEAQQLLVATNRGTKPLVVTSIHADEPFQALAEPLTLAPGESSAIMVRFRSREAWHGKAMLVLEGKGFGAAREVPLLAEANAPAAIEVEPLSLSFGAVEVDGLSKGTITIRNTGGDELRVEHFQHRAVPAEIGSTTVPVGGSQTLEVHFGPTSTGLHQSDLVIRSSDPEKSIVTVRLDGTGIDHAPSPAIRVRPASIDFGKVPLGGQAEATLSIVNAGTDPLSITNLVLMAPFSAPTRGREIPAGATLALPVTFTPPSEGMSFAPLVIYSNDPGVGVLTVGLLGEGILTAGTPAGGSSIATNSGSSAGSNDVSRGVFGSDPGELGAVATQGTGAAGAVAADSQSDASTSARATLPPVPPGVLDGSRVYLGTYEGQISAASVGDVSFDAKSGLLSVSDVQLPSVDAALGEYFRFSPTAGVGRVDAKGGEAEISLPVEVLDHRGNKTPVLVKLTTGTSSTVIAGGTQISVTGKPVGADGVATFVAAYTMQSGALQGMPMTFQLNMKVK